jgi:hypothetical protein
MSQGIDPKVLGAKLVMAVSAYDRRQAAKPGYNRYALPQYMGAVQQVEEELEAGTPLRQAIVKNFCGRLLDACLRAVGEPISTREEQMI